MSSFFESGKDKASKRKGWAPPFITVPKIHLVSNPHCIYDFKLWETFALNTLGWSGGAMVLGKLSVPGHPTDTDNDRSRA